MTACVYLIKAFNGNGLVKIGKTANLERRMRELKAPPGNRLLVIELPDEEIMHEVEQSLQDDFAQDRIPQSEMFSLTAGQIKECKELMIGWEEYHSPPPLTPEQELAAIRAAEQAERLEEKRIEELIEQSIRLEERKEREAREEREAAVLEAELEAELKKEKAKRDRYQSKTLLLCIFSFAPCFIAGAAMACAITNTWHPALRSLAVPTAAVVVAGGCAKAISAKRNKYS